MAERDDKPIVDHAAELDDSYQPDAAAAADKDDASEALAAAHRAGHHETYDPQCPQCRRAARDEYQRKLASGDLNRIDGVD